GRLGRGRASSVSKTRQETRPPSSRSLAPERSSSKGADMTSHARSIAVLAAFLVATVAGAGIARAQVTAAEAGNFMGEWTINLDSPQGPFAMTLKLADKEGKVEGELSSDIAPPQTVTEISKSDVDLVLKYIGNFQGQSFDAKITLTPDGDKNVKVLFDVMSGQFLINATAVKEEAQTRAGAERARRRSRGRSSATTRDPRAWSPPPD